VIDVLKVVGVGLLYSATRALGGTTK
jgi:hypothetical protein